MSRSVESRPGGIARVAWRYRLPAAAAAATAVAVVGVTVPALAQASTGPAHSGATSHSTGAGTASTAKQESLRIQRYWTRARMRSARNADFVTVKGHARATTVPHPSGPAHSVAGAAPTRSARGSHLAVGRDGSTGSPWTGNYYLPPATTSGKVFFTTTGNGQTENWVCSGSAVNSNGKNVVWTAGHCVFGNLGGEVPGEGWHSNWEFVPDYSNGYAPYGVWTAHQLWTLTAYYNSGGSGDEGDDMGAAAMNTNSYGQHIVDVVGGQGIAWNYSDNQFVYDFGYPAASPFNGQTLQFCTGSEFDGGFALSGTEGLACNFTGGSSGGPWLMQFGGEFGYVNGDNAYVLYALPGDMFSPYYGGNAVTLYNSVANL